MSVSSDNSLGRLGLLCLEYDGNPMVSFLGERHDLVSLPDWNEDAIPRDIDAAVTHSEFLPRTGQLVHACRRRNIPVIHFADGMLEWRNTWTQPRINERSEANPLLQPVAADKIACIGLSQMRILDSWGNQGKTELVGLPRLDEIAAVPRPAGDPVVLVTTANQPGFSDAQREAIARSLGDVRDTISRLGWRVVWRLTGGLDAKLGASNDPRPLREILPLVHVVVSTPSTIFLEAMRAERPVISLDYTNSPVLTDTVWRVSTREHLEPALCEALAFPPPHQRQQLYLRRDQLCEDDPRGRAFRLVDAVVDCFRRGVALPERILPIHAAHFPPLPLEALYPNHQALRERDLGLLQREVGDLRNALRSERELRDQQLRELAQRLSGYESSRVVRAAKRVVDRWRAIRFGRGQPQGKEETGAT